MKVSVLIPTYNRELYIKESLESILNQTYENLDIIIYDDGSTDNTCRIVASFEDPRIRLLIGKKNKGVGHARNELIKACTTKYACWQDSDDISTPLRIELQMMEIADDVLVFCGWLWIAYSQIHKRWVHERKQSSLAFATLLFPVDKSIKFNEDMKIGGEDWEWVGGMRKIYKKEKITKDICYKVRRHGDRIGAWKRKFRASISKELLKKLSYHELIEYYKGHYEK